MQGVICAKVLDLKVYTDQIAQVLGFEWKVAPPPRRCSSAARPRCSCKSRMGVLSLLLARSGFLEEIVDHLDAISVTPQMLCPRGFGVEPVAGDCGNGPPARDFLHHEPRFLRWLLGHDPLSPWPVRGTPLTQPRHELRLIRCANSEGGDDRMVNAPCLCATCRGEVSIPSGCCPRERTVSLTPSAC